MTTTAFGADWARKMTASKVAADVSSPPSARGAHL